MASFISASAEGRCFPWLTGVVQTAFLLVPAALLFLGSSLCDGESHLILLFGGGFELLAATVVGLRGWGWRQPLGSAFLVPYLTALAWFWLGAVEMSGWYPHLAQAVFLVVPLAAFAVQTVIGSGAPSARRACSLAQRLARRRDWPTPLGACRSLPEVKALRDALRHDPTPGLALLQQKRPEVQIAALAALEFRKDWQPRESRLILLLAETADQPTVRAAAITALGNVDDREIVERLAEFLRDPVLEVRRAAGDALLWDIGRRWSWIRHALRRALADPVLQDEDPLRYIGQLLTPEAVHDLTSWAAERGLLAVRAAQSLGAHYARALNEEPDEQMHHHMGTLVACAQTPIALRLELARLLKQHDGLDPNLLQELLGSTNPAPLRLLAAEVLLAEGENADAVAALRDIARLPNREIALSTAEVVQRCLSIDLGLALGQPLPPLHSRQAAEVTRRVMLWAASPLALATHAS